MDTEKINTIYFYI